MRTITAADRKLLLGFLGMLVLVFALVGSNVAANHAPKPHALPIGVVGSPSTVAKVTSSLAESAAGAYRVVPYPTAEAARTAILHRAVYAAYRSVPSPLLLIASAASPVVATIVQRSFTAAQGSHAQTLVVRDLAALPRSDPNGTTAFSMILSLILAGMMGSTIIYLLGQHRSPPERLGLTIALAVGAGLLTALVTNVLVSAFPGHFVAVWGVATLFVLAIGVPIAAFQTLLGVGGTAIGAVLFLVIGNPASGGASAPELLPSFWRHLSQLLPPGAASTAARDVVYFHGHGMTQALLVLGGYVVLGGATVFAVHALRVQRNPGAALA